ncbi:hypothetical protein, partial [Streptococcus pneumoniae]|uniref:hypothetical protein n=1 Tax=Streptococcus pneumoniae TaxID=1313 RepID=UPI001CDA56C6
MIFEEYQFVKIGDKKYRVRSVPMIHSTPPQSVLDRDTFTIDYTDDELLDKEAVFTPNHSYLSQLDVTYKTPDLMSHFLP